MVAGRPERLPGVMRREESEDGGEDTARFWWRGWRPSAVYLEVKSTDRAHSRGSGPYLRVRPGLHRRCDPLFATGLPALRFHGLRGDLGSGARAAVRRLQRGPHLQYYRTQAYHGVGGAWLRSLLG